MDDEKGLTATGWINAILLSLSIWGAIVGGTGAYLTDI